MKRNKKNEFQISIGNLSVLQTIPEMMTFLEWRKKVRLLVFEFLQEMQKIERRKDRKHGKDNSKN